MMKNLVIIGAGGCGRELLQWSKDINAVEQRWIIKGFLEYDEGALKDKICSAEIIGNDDSYGISEDDEFVCGIGNCELREKVIKKFMAKGAKFVNLIHPSSIISETSKLGNAVIVYPFVSISDNTIIGDGTIINSHTSIGHDVHIGKFCTISAHCDVTGMCTLGDRVFMGSTSHVVPNSGIGDDAYICAGSTVMASVRSDLKVLGNPAKIVKF